MCITHIVIPATASLIVSLVGVVMLVRFAKWVACALGRPEAWQKFLSILLVLGIAAFLGILAPGFLMRSHTSGPHLNACVANMKQIDGAISTWALEHKWPDGTAVDTSELFGPDKYITRQPNCPAGGDYIYSRVGDPVQVKCPNAARLPHHVLPPSEVAREHRPWRAR
jgi:hypothetical protein